MQLYETEVAEYRTEVRYSEGIEYLVVPVVMMVEGVHHGSHGPLLHLAEELGRYPSSWDGIPVTLGHPQNNEGQNVSANSPEILGQYAVGTIFNTHMDGLKLRADAWIDIRRAIAIAPEALEYIRNHTRLEVSVGVFSDEEEVDGTYNNEQYEGIARNHRPDHLALLPGERGACGWSDGCGIRANQLQILKLNANEMKKEQIDTLKSLIREGFSVKFVTNEQGQLQLLNKLQNKLDSMDTDQAIYFLEELYDGYIIYRRRERESGESTLHQQYFSVNTEDNVEFTGEPSLVRKDINYVNINKNKVETNKGGKKMTRKDETPCCPDKVDALIANKASKFEEGDKEWLLTQSSAILDKLTPAEVKVEKKVEPKKEPAVNMSDYVRKADLKEMDDYIDLAPKEIADQLKAGIQLHAERRATLISSILANAQEGAWTENELKEQDAGMLEKLAKQFPNPVDYSGQGAGKVLETNESEMEIMVPAGVEIKESK